MAWFSVGPSSYPDLKGQEQFTNSERIALQFLSMKVDFDALPSSLKSGARLSVNEARRTKQRCEYLWANRFVLGIVVAPLYTSRHYEATHGNALDIGVTMPDGTNRALTDAEFAWMHQQAELRGFTWTGRNFGEPWHIEGATRTELIAPYADARTRVANYSRTPRPDDTEEQLRRLLMAFKDTLTIHQRIGTNGKDEDTYAISAPGVCAYLIRNGVKQPLALRIGRQLSTKEIRTIFTDEGAAFEKLAAATFDRRIAAHASIAELAQGKQLDKDGVVI
jgi:hypothetical protein